MNQSIPECNVNENYFEIQKANVATGKMILFTFFRRIDRSCNDSKKKKLLIYGKINSKFESFVDMMELFFHITFTLELLIANWNAFRSWNFLEYLILSWKYNDLWIKCSLVLNIWNNCSQCWTILIAVCVYSIEFVSIDGSIWLLLSSSLPPSPPITSSII